MNAHSTNIISLGIEKGAFMVGNDKIGVFHGLDKIPYGYHKKSYDVYRKELSTSIGEELPKVAHDCIYSFLGHYHTGIHNPAEHFSVVSHAVKGALLITMDIEDGTVKKIYANRLILTKNETNFADDPYQIELYNSDIQYKKHKSH